MDFIRIPGNMESILPKLLSCRTLAEAELLADISGCERVDVKRDFGRIGHLDFLTVEFGGRTVPFQVMRKDEDGNTLILQSVYALERRAFDDRRYCEWGISSIRKYLNSDFLKNFSLEFLELVGETKVYTDSPTKDRFWLASPYEMCYLMPSSYDSVRTETDALAFLEEDRGATSPMRRLDLNGSPCDWWLRSRCAVSGGFAYVAAVSHNGHIYGSTPGNKYGVIPVCVVG